LEETDNLHLNEGFTAEETELLGCEADRITGGVCYKNGERYDCPLEDECPVDFSTERGRRNYARMLIKRKKDGEPLTEKQEEIMAHHLGLKKMNYVLDTGKHISAFADQSSDLVALVHWHSELEKSDVLFFREGEIRELSERLVK